MKIERYQPGRRQTSPELLACGCLGVGSIGIVLTAILAIILIPALPGMVLSNFGIEDMGDTNEILSEQIATVPALMDTQTVGSVTLNTGSYSQTLAGAGTGYNVIMGDTEDMMQMQMQISFTEDGMLEQCRELTTICSSNSDTMRNASFDLRSGGLIINAEFELPTGQWQQAGLVVRFGTNNRIEIAGVDIAGRVYAPTNTDLASLVNEAETQANLFVNQLSARAGIDEFNLSTIVIDDNTLTLILG